MRAHLLSPRQTSLLLHLFIAGIFVVLSLLEAPVQEAIEVPIEVTLPKDVQNLSEVKENQKPKVTIKSVNEAPPKGSPGREVFGASRSAHVDEAIGDEGVTFKKGNTLAKEADEEILSEDDSDSLPTPTDEYLVSEMPSVISEVRPRYPKEARDRQLEGAVVMDILIDAAGAVRQVTVIEGPKEFLLVAREAMARFKFKPASVEGSPVAVRIRYTLRFQLEY